MTFYKTTVSPTGEHIKTPVVCPCERNGEGCMNYHVQRCKPYYICQFTKTAAYVPTDDGELGAYDGMYG